MVPLILGNIKPYMPYIPMYNHATILYKPYTTHNFEKSALGPQEMHSNWLRSVELHVRALALRMELNKYPCPDVCYGLGFRVMQGLGTNALDLMHDEQSCLEHNMVQC